MTGNPTVARLRKEAAAEGYVLMRAASRARLIERTRVAEALQAAAEDRARDNRLWMERDVFPRERQLADRCTFLYGAAIARGATPEELSTGPTREDSR